MITYVVEKLNVSMLNVQSERIMNSEHKTQVTHHSLESSNALDFHYLDSSVLASCGPSFKCGGVSASCRSIGSVDNDAVSGNSSSHTPSNLEANNKITIKPFRKSKEADNIEYYTASSNVCDIPSSTSAYKVCSSQAPRLSSRSIPGRFASPEVVKTQPISDGLITTL